MRLARVFPTRTKMCPIDKDVYFGLPGLYTPKYDEIHISVTFTWDLPKIDILKGEWSRHGKVKVGGPALGDAGGPFTSGRYLKAGVTITSRGCPNNCPWCFVPEREGKIRELPIVPGNIVQDNNLLACSKSHLDKVFAMLQTQRAIDFSGGFDATRVTDEIVEELRSLRIHQIWLAYDHPNNKNSVLKAIQKLKCYFPRDKLRCYVLIGYKDDTFEKARIRLKEAWEMGTLPFAMRYRTPSGNWEDTYLFQERVWNLLTRSWSRPAIIKSMMGA